jgi:hypothetical protein
MHNKDRVLLKEDVQHGGTMERNHLEAQLRHVLIVQIGGVTDG